MGKHTLSYETRPGVLQGVLQTVPFPCPHPNVDPTMPCRACTARPTTHAHAHPRRVLHAAAPRSRGLTRPALNGAGPGPACRLCVCICTSSGCSHTTMSSSSTSLVHACVAPCGEGEAGGMGGGGWGWGWGEKGNAQGARRLGCEGMHQQHVWYGPAWRWAQGGAGKPPRPPLPRLAWPTQPCRRQAEARAKARLVRAGPSAGHP